MNLFKKSLFHGDEEDIHVLLVTLETKHYYRNDCSKYKKNACINLRQPFKTLRRSTGLN